MIDFIAIVSLLLKMWHF